MYDHYCYFIILSNSEDSFKKKCFDILHSDVRDLVIFSLIFPSIFLLNAFNPLSHLHCCWALLRVLLDIRTNEQNQQLFELKYCMHNINIGLPNPFLKAIMTNVQVYIFFVAFYIFYIYIYILKYPKDNNVPSRLSS